MADNVIVRVPEQQFIRGEDGYSPEVTIENIDHGHSVTITDREHQEEGQTFNVLDGDSAYEQAVAGGYTGTEAQFNEELASFKELSDEAKDAAPFYAEYGVTTKAEIETAINGKRQIYVHSALGMDYAPLVGTFLYLPMFGNVPQTGYRFATVEGTTQYIYDLRDEWFTSENDLAAPAQRAETAAAQALTRMNSADASAQAAAATATTFTEETVPAAVNTINEAKADALTAVGNAQTTAVGAVQQESTTQQAAIQQKGEDTLASIPADYTELSGDVDDLKSAINTESTPFNWTKIATRSYPLGWRIGRYRASNGTYNATARTAICTGFGAYIASSNVKEIKITAPSGYKVACCEYNERGAFVRTIGSTVSGTAELQIQTTPNYVYKFTVGEFATEPPVENFLTSEFINSITLVEYYYIESVKDTKHLNILLFGNSYGADSFAYVPFMLKKYGITTNIHFYYRGSGSVDRLVAEWEDDSATGFDDFGKSHVRRYAHIDTRYETAWESVSTDFHPSPKSVLELANTDVNIGQWDIIVLFTGSRSQSFTKAPGNGDPRKGAEPYIRQAINLINASYTKPYKLAWFEDYTSFDGYPGNTQQGYPPITPQEMDNRVGVLKSTETIMGAEPFDMVIPAGAAVFNARTNASLASTNLSVTGNLWCSDKIHLQAGIPNYIVNCAVVQSIFNKFFPELSILNDDTRITDTLISDYACPFISSWCGSVLDSTDMLYDLGQKAAVMACKYPYDITPIYLPTDATELELFDSHSNRYWADALITQPNN